MTITIKINTEHFSNNTEHFVHHNLIIFFYQHRTFSKPQTHNILQYKISTIIQQIFDRYSKFYNNFSEFPHTKKRKLTLTWGGVGDGLLVVRFAWALVRLALPLGSPLRRVLGSRGCVGLAACAGSNSIDDRWTPNGGGYNCWVGVRQWRCGCCSCSLGSSFMGGCNEAVGS